MLKVGITGGIGSGKTTICRIFEQLGVPVFYADDEAKKVLERKDVVSLLESVFGKEIIDENAGINRSKLAAVVFNNEAKLKQLNNIIHPEVAKVFNDWLEEHKMYEYIIKEAAILFESGASKALDKNISINAPLEIRLQRVMKRDGVDREKVMDRIKNQYTDEEREVMADFTIVNDDKRAVIPQVLELHRKIRLTNKNL